ncbi:hypothetical protein ZWY2020_029093 [Hordeum vulgare]|nr:hypothetical protein ZWY2020_029093 [Hordeum vulgare]
MTFVGVSLVDGDRKLCASTVSPIDCRAASGYHLLVVEGFSRTRDVLPAGEYIRCPTFLVRGHRWYLEYYPNGCDSEHAGDIMTREMLERSKHLKDDSFTIRCDIVVHDVKSKPRASTMAPPFIQGPPSDMPIHFKDLLLSKEGADVMFVVSGETFAAHRCVLAARSTVFKSQLFGDNLGSATVKIDDIEAQVFEGMLTFIYTDTLPDWGKFGIRKRDEAPQDGHVSVCYVTLLLQLLEAAERYDLPRLKSICQQVLVGSIRLETVGDIIVGAERGHCPWLKEECLEFIKSHTSLHEVFTAQGFEQMTRTCRPSGLKELISKFAY